MVSKPFHDHFSGVASRYADFRPRYPESLFDFLKTLLPDGAVVWDCAAGNGQATVGLAARFKHVVATDASADQIRSAKPLPNVDYRVATAEASGLPDASVDLVTVAQALHWFKFDQFYREVRRVLKPGGFLAVWAYGINVVESHAVNEIVLDFYSRVVGPYWPPERILVEEGYRTIPFPFEEISVPPFCMEANWTREQLLGYFSTWSATSRYIKATGRNPIEDLAGALQPFWPEPDSARLVTWPLSVRVGR